MTRIVACSDFTRFFCVFGVFREDKLVFCLGVIEEEKKILENKWHKIVKQKKKKCF